MRRFLILLWVFALPLFGAPITLRVDATDAPSNVFHSHLTIPASAGPLTLYYPKWIPGEHAPSGPVVDLTGVKFTGNGQFLKWRHALDDNWTINVDVPPGVPEVHATLDFVAPVAADTGLFSAGASQSEKLQVISWNQVVLYPKGWTSDQLSYTASLRLPAG